MNSEERFSRQRDLVPIDRLAACQATVIGVGAIGRQAALQLTAMGVPWLQLVDFDIVEDSNLASQGFREADLGKPKVEATADLCRSLNQALKIVTVGDRFRRSMDIGNIVFCCVDRIETRRLIWNGVRDSADLFTDGRMSAEVLRVVSAWDPPSRDYYPSTLFEADEAYAGPCTAKSTIYCANIAAGLMVTQLAKYLRRMPLEMDIQLNLLSSELAVGSA